LSFIATDYYSFEYTYYLSNCSSDLQTVISTDVKAIQVAYSTAFLATIQFAICATIA
jgi:hypothetical protein